MTTHLVAAYKFQNNYLRLEPNNCDFDNISVISEITIAILRFCCLISWNVGIETSIIPEFICILSETCHTLIKATINCTRIWRLKMSETRNKIDTSIPPHLRPRPAGWPSDWECREYFSSIIPKFYQPVNLGLNKEDSKRNKVNPYTTLWTKRWLIENDRLLKEQREEDESQGFCEDRRQAAIDAREDMRLLEKSEKLDRREAAVKACDCLASYEGNCKNDCRGDGISGECNKCSGQAVPAGGTTYTKQKSRHVDSGGARQPRQRGHQGSK